MGLDVDEFLARPLFAHLATESPQGARSSPVWFSFEEGSVWIIGNRKTDTFPSRIEADPRCAISIVDFDRSSGRVHHVGMRGRATVEPWDPKRAIRLLARFLGHRVELWDQERFVTPLDDPDNVFVRFEPASVVARDQTFVPSPDVGAQDG